MYDRLMSDSNCSLRWFCPKWDNQVMLAGTYPDDNNSGKLNSLKSCW